MLFGMGTDAIDSPPPLPGIGAFLALSTSALPPYEFATGLADPAPADEPDPFAWSQDLADTELSA